MDKIILEELNRVREIMGLKKPLIIDKPKITNLREDRGTGAVNLIKRLFMGADNLLKKEVKDKDFIKNILSDEIDDADKLIQSAGLEDELEQAVLKGSDEVDKVLAKIAGLSDNTKILKLLVKELAPLIFDRLEKLTKELDDFFAKNKVIPESMIDELGNSLKSNMKNAKLPDGTRLYDDNFINDVVNQFIENQKTKFAGKIAAKSTAEKFAFLAEALNFLRIHLKYVWRSQENLREVIIPKLINEINADVSQGKLIRVKAMELAQAILSLKKWGDEDIKLYWDTWYKNNDGISKEAKEKLKTEFERNTVIQSMFEGEVKTGLKDQYAAFKSSLGSKLELIPIIRAFGLSLQKRGGDFSLWQKMVPLEADRWVNFILWRDPRSVNEIAEVLVQKGVFQSKLSSIASSILVNYLLIPMINAGFESFADNIFLVAQRQKQRIEELDALKEYCELAKEKYPNNEEVKDFCNEKTLEEVKNINDEETKSFWSYYFENFPIWGTKSQVPPSGYLGFEGNWALVTKGTLSFTYIDEVMNGARYIFTQSWKDADSLLEALTDMADDKAKKMFKQTGFDFGKSLDENIQTLKDELETITTPEPPPTEKTYTADEEGFKKFCEDATDPNDKDNTGYEFLEGMIDPETRTYYGKAISRGDKQPYDFKSVDKDGKVSFEPYN